MAIDLDAAEKHRQDVMYHHDVSRERLALFCDQEVPALIAEVRRLREALDNAHSKIAQAYQVIGTFDENGSSEEVVRALDYFSQTERYDEEFLPWGDFGEDKDNG